MTHDTEKQFAQKHRSKKIDDTLAAMIKKKVIDGRISCRAAHEIASTAGVSPAKIGEQTDLLEFHLTKCQLGLFGYKNKKKFNPDIEISPELNKKIDAAVKDKRISCSDCWDIGESLNIHRLDIGSACEKKGLKIKPCQLGAF